MPLCGNRLVNAVKDFCSRKHEQVLLGTIDKAHRLSVGESSANDESPARDETIDEIDSMPISISHDSFVRIGTRRISCVVNPPINRWLLSDVPTGTKCFTALPLGHGVAIKLRLRTRMKIRCPMPRRTAFGTAAGAAERGVHRELRVEGCGDSGGAVDQVDPS